MGLNKKGWYKPEAELRHHVLASWAGRVSFLKETAWDLKSQSSANGYVSQGTPAHWVKCSPQWCLTDSGRGINRQLQPRRGHTCDSEVGRGVNELQAPLLQQCPIQEQIFPLWVQVISYQWDLAAIQVVYNLIWHTCVCHWEAKGKKTGPQSQSATNKGRHESHT